MTRDYSTSELQCFFYPKTKTLLDKTPMICNSALLFDSAHALLDMAALLKPMMCLYPIVC